MPTLLEAGVKIPTLLLIISSHQELFKGFGQVGGGIHIQYTHVVYTVLPLSLEVSDKEIPLQILLVL